MAVEARHHQMTLFPNQVISTRDSFVKAINPGTFNMYNSNNSNPQSDVVGIPYSNEAVMPETLLPIYQSLVCDYPYTSAAANNNNNSNKLSLNNKADSGLTYNVPPPAVAASRKRPRDPFFDLDQAFTSQSQKTKFCSPAAVGGLSSFVDDDVVFQIQQHQSEIDRYIAEHNHKVRVELEERRKRQSRMLVSAIQEGVMRKLKEKDEELQRIGKLNWALQERVKALYVENQLWRDLAQTNEATANSLRSNLEAVLAHVSEDRLVASPPVPLAPADDAESSCGSSGDVEAGPTGTGGRGACRKCGERESSVLLLPCRHLCLCTVCGSSSVGTCPVCDSVMTASVHVNLS